MHDLNHSAKVLNDDLKKNSEWTYKWKTLFNPDITKPAQEVIFSRKNIKTDHPIAHFNEAPVAHTVCQKHLGMHLDEKGNYMCFIKLKLPKFLIICMYYFPQNHILASLVT